MKISNLYKYLGRKRWLLILYLIVNPINSVLEILLAYAIAAAIEYAISGAVGEIFSYVAAFLVYIAVWFLFSNLHTIIRNKLLENSIVSLKADLVDHLMFASPNEFNCQNTGTYLAHLTSDIEIIRNSYFFEFLSIYGQAVQFVVALVAMLFVNVILGAFVVGMALVQVLIPVIKKKRISGLGAGYSKQQQAYTKGCKETLGAFQTANLFGVQKELSDLHAGMAQKAEKARSHSKIINSVVNELSFSAGNVMYLGFF